MDAQSKVAEVLGRWREEAEQGRVVDPQTLIDSHPDIAEELRRHLEAQGLVDGLFAELEGRSLHVPETLGDYRLGRELGRGGMGVVYEAEQISMERRVALKVPFPTIATTVSTRKRFEREARLTPSIAPTSTPSSETRHAAERPCRPLLFPRRRATRRVGSSPPTPTPSSATVRLPSAC